MPVVLITLPTVIKNSLHIRFKRTSKVSIIFANSLLVTRFADFSIITWQMIQMKFHGTFTKDNLRTKEQLIRLRRQFRCEYFSKQELLRWPISTQAKRYPNIQTTLQLPAYTYTLHMLQRNYMPPDTGKNGTALKGKGMCNVGDPKPFLSSWKDQQNLKV